jgi:hypothetical protein
MVTRHRTQDDLPEAFFHSFCGKPLLGTLHAPLGAVFGFASSGFSQIMQKPAQASKRA